MHIHGYVFKKQGGVIQKKFNLLVFFYKKKGGLSCKNVFLCFKI